MYFNKRSTFAGIIEIKPLSVKSYITEKNISTLYDGFKNYKCNK